MVRMWVMIAASMLASEAQAGFQTGNELYTYCNTPIASKDNAFCIGYVQGLADAIQLEQAIVGTARSICMPPDVTGRQVTDVILKRLRDHPESRNRTGALEATDALKAAFPCK